MSAWGGIQGDRKHRHPSGFEPTESRTFMGLFLTANHFILYHSVFDSIPSSSIIVNPPASDEEVPKNSSQRA